jgi:cytochrome bd-type quinol oxidase subunit 2
MNKVHRLGLLTALAVTLCVVFGASATASQTTLSRDQAVVQLAPASADHQSADTPSPEPSGSADGNNDDWSGIPWLFLALLVPVIVVGGVVVAKRRTGKESGKHESQ